MPQRLIPAILGVLVCGFATSLSAENQIACSESNLPPTSHKTLLYYALLAKAAYQDLGEWLVELPDSCPKSVRDFLPKKLVIESIPKRMLVQAKTDVEHTEKECGKPTPVINFHTKTEDSSDDFSEDIVSCSRDTSVSARLAMSFRYVAGNNEMTLLGKTMIVINNTLFEVERLRIEEIPDSDGKRKKIVFQGTDFSDLDQLGTSVKALMENSCLFDFAAELSSRFFIENAQSFSSEDTQDGLQLHSFSKHNAIVGHSLGGAVAQYVGHHKDLQTEIRDLNSRVQRYNVPPTFGVYSFNSIGLSGVPQRQWHDRRIRSVQVHGDILAAQQGKVGTRQLGQIYRYGLRLGVPQNNIERLGRHGIAKMLEEICYCSMNKGDFVFDNQS